MTSTSRDLLAAGDRRLQKAPAEPDPADVRRPADPAPAVPNSGSTALPQSPARPVPAQARPAVPEPEAEAEPEPDAVPRYLTMERKDVRLRRDQTADLTALARRLSRNRTVRTERITDATLVRIGVDIVLAFGDQLAGQTEEELREGLGEMLGLVWHPGPDDQPGA